MSIWSVFFYGFPYPFGLAWRPETIENNHIAPRGGKATGPNEGWGAWLTPARMRVFVNDLPVPPQTTKPASLRTLAIRGQLRGKRTRRLPCARANRPTSPAFLALTSCLDLDTLIPFVRPLWRKQMSLANFTEPKYYR